MPNRQDILNHPSYSGDRMEVIAATLAEASETVLMDVHPGTDTLESFIARKQAAESLESMAETARRLV